MKENRINHVDGHGSYSTDEVGAWDEKVVNTAAYDETVTVTTGYKCSCGATKPAN